MAGGFRLRRCLLLVLCSWLAKAFENPLAELRAAASPVTLSGKTAVALCLAVWCQESFPQAALIQLIGSLGQAFQNSIRPAVPATYIPCGGNILAHASSLPDDIRIRYIRYEDDDDEYGYEDDEDEIEYSLEDHTKSAGQDVVAEAIADLRKIVPRRPHLLGMGWLEARNLPMR